jgi:hypothetical protein
LPKGQRLSRKRWRVDDETGQVNWLLGDGMIPEKYGWCIRALLKFALLGFPALIALWCWRRKGPDSKFLYYLGWANLGAYLLWLFVGSFLTLIASDSQISQWIFSSSIPAAFAFFVPFLFSIGSLFLCFLSFLAKEKERSYPALSSILMLILWIASVVAPN